MISALSLISMGCSKEDIAPARKGRMLDKTGAIAFYTGGAGFEGPILGPGTYFTGMYDEIRSVDCSQETKKEPMEALTKDGVQFKLDVYVRFSVDCADKNVEWILNNVSPLAAATAPAQEKKEGDSKEADRPTPEEPHCVSVSQLYATYIRPAIGAAIRETISPYIANDVNNKREEILTQIRKTFQEMMDKKDPKIMTIYEVQLSNLDFPDELDKANAERATQAILKDKAVAEKDRVDAEVKTAEARLALAKAQGDSEAMRIDTIGAALERHPEYLTFNLQTMMPEIYREAGSKGNLVLTGPPPLLTLPAPAQKK